MALAQMPGLASVSAVLCCLLGGAGLGAQPWGHCRCEGQASGGGAAPAQVGRGLPAAPLLRQPPARLSHLRSGLSCRSPVYPGSSFKGDSGLMQQTPSFRRARKHSTSDTRVLGPVCQACAAQGVGWGQGAALDRPRGTSACSPGAEADPLGLPAPETGEPAPQVRCLGLPAPETGEPAPQADLLGLPALETGKPSGCAVWVCRPLRRTLPRTRCRGWRRVPSSAGRVLCWLAVPPQQALLSQTSGFPFSKTSTRSKRELLKQFKEHSLWL